MPQPAPANTAPAVFRSKSSHVMQLRQTLWANGFRPIAVRNGITGDDKSGKAPQGKDWIGRARQDVPEAATAKDRPEAQNTGILCDGLRAVDVDIDDPAIAEVVIAIAVEMLGVAPRKSRPNSPRVTLLYRADEGEPCKRQVAGDRGKVEILGHGQQFVAFGMHHSGAELVWDHAPTAFHRDTLTPVTEAAVDAFLTRVSTLIGAPAPRQPASNAVAQAAFVSGDEVETDDAIFARLSDDTSEDELKALWNGDWQHPYWQGQFPSHSEARASLAVRLKRHTDSPAQLARMLHKSELFLQRPDKAHDVERCVAFAFSAGIPRTPTRAELVRLTCDGVPVYDFAAWRAKADSEAVQRDGAVSEARYQPASQPASAAIPANDFSNVVSLNDMLADHPTPAYVWHHVFQRGFVYALTALWGHGKTAVAITVAAHLAAGKELSGHRTKPCRVLYLCGENPDDVKLRVRATLKHFEIEQSDVADRLLFTKLPFNIDDDKALARFVADAGRHGQFDFMVIDTGPAHSGAEDENTQRDAKALAVGARKLMLALGKPATLVLMHPVKNAGRDNLEPRGGGAFSGEVDGLTCGWQDAETHVIEFFHKTKFRGPGFESMFFHLAPHTFDDVRDNFDEAATTVIAVPTNERPNAKAPKLSKFQRHFLKSMEACNASPPPAVLMPSGNGPLPSKVVAMGQLYVEWQKLYDGKSVKIDTPRRTFSDVSAELLEQGLVCNWGDCWWLPEWVPGPLPKAVNA